MRTFGRIAGIAIVTLICTFLANLLAGGMMRNHGASDAVTFLGGVFGFWLAYTGRLARMFRKVETRGPEDADRFYERANNLRSRPAPAALRLFALFWWVLVIVTVGWLLICANTAYQYGYFTRSDPSLYDWSGLPPWQQDQQQQQSTQTQQNQNQPTIKDPWDDLPCPQACIIQASRDLVSDFTPEFWSHDALVLALYMLLGLLPYSTMTLVRWLITSRWRFGPCWLKTSQPSNSL